MRSYFYIYYKIMSIHDIKTGSFEEGLNKIYSMILINSNYIMDFDEEAISYFRDFFDESYETTWEKHDKAKKSQEDFERFLDDLRDNWFEI